jgi:hypothetical protein
MFDETFYVTVRPPSLPTPISSLTLMQKGTVRFHSPGRGHIDAVAGDLIIIPIRLPHKFSNPFDEDGVFISTMTPGFYARYFELLEEMIGEGKTLTKEINMEAMKRFATVPLTDEMVRQFEEMYAEKGKE